MTVRYTTETGYIDKEDMVVIDNITFDTDNITIKDISNIPMDALKGFIGSWILQALEEFDNEPQLDNEELEWFFEDIENHEPMAYYRAELIELEDYVTVDMVLEVVDSELTMMLDVWG